MTARRIFLTGYMGAGKTTLGRAFAAAEGLQFVDLDWYIEERTHRTVQQLFAEGGEEGFRRTEQRLLHEVACFEDVVVATGGGTPCFFDNMEVMNRAGITVFLDVPVPVLLARLRVAGLSTGGRRSSWMPRSWTTRRASAAPCRSCNGCCTAILFTDFCNFFNIYSVS